MPYEDEPTPYENLAEPDEELDRLARETIGAAIEVHRHLSIGLPEAAYQNAMEIELAERGIPFERQKRVEVYYKGRLVAHGCIDLLVGKRLVVENKSCAALIATHRLQTLTYMRLVHEPLGLLINFNVPLLKDGIKRIIASK